MKKVVSWILTIALLFSLVPAGTFAITAQAISTVSVGTCGMNMSWALDSDGVLTIYGTGDMREYSRKEEVPWYSNRTSIKKVVIRSGVTSISQYAFYDNSNVTVVALPDSLTSIGLYAFGSCDRLNTIYFAGPAPAFGKYVLSGVTATAYYYPDETWTADVMQKQSNITWVAQTEAMQDLTFELSDDGTFYTVTGLNRICTNTDIVIPDTYLDKPVKAIGYGAFMDDYAITNIKISNSVEIIGAKAFYGRNLTSVTIPDGVTSIGEQAFAYCDYLTNITIPKSVTSIGGGAFSNCDRLSGIWVSSGNTNYSNDEFGVLFDAYKTTLIQAPSCLSGGYMIPDSVTSVGDYAFANCRDLTSVTFKGNSVTRIGDSAFYFCTSLTSITIPNGVTHIGDSAFNTCGITSLTFPDSVTSIGMDVCSAREIYFEGPAPVMSIWAFRRRTATAYYYPDETWTPDVLQNYGGTITWVPMERVTEDLIFTLSEDGTYYSVTGLKDSCTDTEIYIPSTYEGKPVKAIGDSAFRGRTTLTGIHIPDSVAAIGDGACYGCISLTSITIPDSVVSIGTEAFYNCYGLTSVTIGSGLGSVGLRAFSRCKNLTTIEVASNNPIYHSANNCLIETNSKTLVIGCQSSKIPTDGSVTSIGTYAFYNCEGLTSIEIPDTVTSIGANAFDTCVCLTDVNLDEGVTSIGSAAFYNCQSLTSVTIPASVTNIGNNAFNGCYNLKNIYFDGKAPSIGNGAFWTVIATAYYYPDETWTENVRKDYGGDITWVALERYYTVTFLDADGKLISEKEYLWGDTITVPADPTKAADKTYTYTFAGWDKKVALACAGNATYTATYEPHYIDYTIVFEDWDGTVLSSKTYHYGDAVTAPANPTRKPDNTYTYEFSRWDRTVTNCTGDATYTAIYTSHYINYIVVFKDWDDTVLSSKIYHYGDEIIVPADPTRAADNTYTYAFSGWDKNVTDCVGDATYTATYRSSYIEYTVTFQYEDGTVIAQRTLHYGDAVEAPAEPVAPGKGYEFSGWDKEITDCQGDAVYTAVFVRNYIAGDINGDGKVDQDDVVYLLLYTMFGENFYPLNSAPGDIDRNGNVEQDDAVYLLLHTMFGEAFYPLNKT